MMAMDVSVEFGKSLLLGYITRLPYCYLIYHLFSICLFPRPRALLRLFPSQVSGRIGSAQRPSHHEAFKVADLKAVRVTNIIIYMKIQDISWPLPL